jgi:DNA polymerase III sliding clamp (beta) subunit (PCNA family)
MLIISTENNRPVVFSFKNNSLNIFTEDSELGSVNEVLTLKEKINKEFSLCINCGYLLDILNAAEDDIVIEYNTKEKDKPIVVRPANKNNITYIIMPMIMS